MKLKLTAFNVNALECWFWNIINGVGPATKECNGHQGLEPASFTPGTQGTQYLDTGGFEVDLVIIKDEFTGLRDGDIAKKFITRKPFAFQEYLGVTRQLDILTSAIWHDIMPFLESRGKVRTVGAGI